MRTINLAIGNFLGILIIVRNVWISVVSTNTRTVCNYILRVNIPNSELAPFSIESRSRSRCLGRTNSQLKPWVEIQLSRETEIEAVGN